MKFLCEIYDKRDMQPLDFFEIDAIDHYFARHQARALYEKAHPEAAKDPNWKVCSVEI